MWAETVVSRVSCRGQGGRRKSVLFCRARQEEGPGWCHEGLPGSGLCSPTVDSGQPCQVVSSPSQNLQQDLILGSLASDAVWNPSV